MKTTILKEKEMKKDWYIIDATGKRLGQISTLISRYLRGKNKSSYADNVDCGDYIIVINAKEVDLHPSKKDTKMYYHHSGYQSGLRSRTFNEMLASKPTEIIREAVKGMVPGNKLGRKIMRKLFVYADKKHPHEAQKPKSLTI